MSVARLPVLDRRRSGVLLHPTSLVTPSRAAAGQGALGAAAREFIDWLAAGGFTVWQVLPLGPVGADHSPYWSRSDGAIGAHLIDWSEAPSPDVEAADYAAFRERESHWLEDYALFEALAVESGAQPWWAWPAAVRDRRSDAVRRARARLADGIERTCREQWIAARQWQALREHAHRRDVRLFGDVPIYVAPDSATVWSQRRQFQLDAQGRPEAVSGVPPDYFSEDGQLWGNPLYDWQQARRDGFAFWRRRMALTLAQFDIVRIDHFRGLCAYWSVPSGARTAREGEWKPAPGAALLEALRGDFPDLPLIAEDLGVITDDVVALRRQFHLPGMRVLQFAFDGQSDNPHLPQSWREDTVAYSGTHDNDTTLGWYAGLTEAERHLVRTALSAPDELVARKLLAALFESVAPLAVIPMQDLLGLGSEARFNVPGVAKGNWTWSLPDGALRAELAEQWRGMNREARRAG